MFHFALPGVLHFRGNFLPVMPPFSLQVLRRLKDSGRYQSIGTSSL